MSDQSNNPYQVSSVSDAPSPSAIVGNGVATAKTRESIGKAAPWLRFLAIMGFIGTGFILIAALVVIFAGSLFSLGQFGMGMVGPLIGVMYMGIGALLFFGARILWRMGKGAKDYRDGGKENDLEIVAGAVHGMAKYYGIITIVVLAIYALALVIGLGALIIGAVR
jgi:phage shock protein PspC (stress-responsive transcriptional regulator)